LSVHTNKQTNEKPMKTVYARVSEVSGKVLINDQLSGVELKCSDNDYMTIYRMGYVSSLNEICFSGDFIIENGVLTLSKSTDDSEF
jgi:hypothetical protein